VFRNTIPIVAAIAALHITTPTASAIEGLQLSLQCSNVVLSWPSIAGQNYIIQYRPTLDPSTPWQTLTNSYPGDWTTNITVLFIPTSFNTRTAAEVAAVQ
jgi:hypothetical protein